MAGLPMETEFVLHCGDGRERRQSTRLACSRFACSCSLKNGSSKGAESEKAGALLLNIGSRGVCLESDSELPLGAVMEFKIRPIEGPEIDAKIRIIHIKPSTTNGFFIIGSQFEDLSEQDRQNLLTLLRTVNRMEKHLENYLGSF